MLKKFEKFGNIEHIKQELTKKIVRSRNGYHKSSKKLLKARSKKYENQFSSQQFEVGKNTSFLPDTSTAKTERLSGKRDTRIPAEKVKIFNNDQYKSQIEKAKKKENEHENLMFFEDESDSEGERKLNITMTEFLENLEKSQIYESSCSSKELISYLSNELNLEDDDMGFERLRMRKGSAGAKKSGQSGLALADTRSKTTFAKSKQGQGLQNGPVDF